MEDFIAMPVDLTRTKSVPAFFSPCRPTHKLTGGLAGAKRGQDRPVERLVGRSRYAAAD
jgi:hypothetical protein